MSTFFSYKYSEKNSTSFYFNFMCDPSSGKSIMVEHMIIRYIILYKLST